VARERKFCFLLRLLFFFHRHRQTTPDVVDERKKKKCKNVNELKKVASKQHQQEVNHQIFESDVDASEWNVRNDNRHMNL
jgi:hypothetical protein